MAKKQKRATKREIHLAIWTLRETGHAVVIFNPKELDGCPADDLESSLVSYGWEEMDIIKAALSKEDR